MFIVGISGLAGSGKTSVAEYVERCFISKGIKVSILNFADPVKEVAMHIFGLSKDDVYTQTGKKRISPNGYGMTNRRILQLLGTESIRDMFHEDVWIDNMKRRVYRHHTLDTVVLIPDTRFDNERLWIKSVGILIDVNRPSLKKDNSHSHASENIASYPVPDYLINNTKDITFLEKVSLDCYSSLLEPAYDTYYKSVAPFLGEKVRLAVSTLNDQL